MAAERNHFLRYTQEEEERQMKLTNHESLRGGGWLGLMSMVMFLMGMVLAGMASAQAVTTTTVQGTVYLANGQPGSGTLALSWPTFTTASGQLVTADTLTVQIAPDGFVSVNLAPNQGATPAGLYYTAVFYLSDGSTNTQYWVVPSAALATLGQVQAQLMPATQAIHAVSKAYVDQAIAGLSNSLLTVTGATMTGPLYLSGDPTQLLQAADKHYVDAQAAASVPASGGTFTGPVTATKLGGAYQVDQFTGADFGAKLSACLSGLSATNGGTCDARNFSGTQAMGSNLTIATANATVLLPCATISTAKQIIVTAGTRNVSLRGCSLRGASTASGSQGGTVFYYSGTGAMVQVGDPTYAADTMGFHLDNVAINTTLSTSATAQGFAAYRTQELDLESLYFLGNSNQTGMTLDGTGNYTGGSFFDNAFNGFQTAVNAIGHQIANAATTDWMNASSFLRLHVDCPTSGGSPISGTIGINLQQGDGNTFTSGDIEGCATALHLGANAQNNTIVGLRNENSTNQAVADAGSSYNDWMTGGTMFTGRLTDNGTRNSFLDTFHRSFNGLNGDWYGSQQDATVTNHYRLGIGTGNERGLLNRYQTDYGYRWTMGLSDATAGEQFYQILDELNNVNRVSIGQYNNGQASTNNQTVINSAGTGAVVLNGSNNAGTGGVVIGSGGPSETTVATISNVGNAQFNGSLQVGGNSTLSGTATVKNQADAEIDLTLWAGLTQAWPESLIYKNYLGQSQWYMENHASNDWSLTSALGGLDSFKAYQSTNSGDTYINTSNASGVVRINYETGSGSQFKVYGGNGSTLYAAMTGPAAIQFPGIEASIGHNCVQIDNSGYLSNTGVPCGTGTSNGTVNTGTNGQIAYYNGAGTTLSGTSAVGISAGGTGASTATGALSNLGGAALAGATFTGPLSSTSTLSAANLASMGPRYDVTNAAFGAKGDGVTDDTAAIQAALNACYNGGVTPYGGVVEFPGNRNYLVSATINAYDSCQIEGVVGSLYLANRQPQIMWNGPATGAVSTITAFSIASNVVTFTAANSLTAGQWVDIEGLTTGFYLNRAIVQVSSSGLSGTRFSATLPFSWSNVTTTSDAGTATTVNVVLAFDSNARYQQSVSNISITNNTTLQANSLSVGIYFGSRVDTGTHVLNTQVQGATMYGYYFANGGINMEFDKGWRSDAAGIAGIYWRVGGLDSFGIANGTVDNLRNGGGSTSSGAAVMLDNSACLVGNGIHFTSRNIKVEINTSLTSGLGAFTFYDCPANITQFFTDFENTWVVPASPSTAGYNFSSFAMSPANDGAISLSVLNGMFPSGQGSNTTVPWVGLPALQRNSIVGSMGYVPELIYAPPYNSAGNGYTADNGPIQLIGDVNINQLWQYGIHASDFLYSDTSFAALPNGTTLYAGQILAPPAYWSGANGKRYAVDVVYQTGTTGTPNGGATTCTGTTVGTLTCTSATDLSTGQRITIGTDTNKVITYVDATHPNAVLVYVPWLSQTYATQTALSFTAPILGLEMQMPTKSSAAPTALAWSQGDMEQNSGATANGVAAWVNVAAGTPGTWAGVPLGNSSGQISSSQISNLAFQSLTTIGSSGAATLSGGVLNIPQYSGGSTPPASANVLGSNSSSQLVTATTHNLSVPANCIAASGSGTAYTCSTSPTFTPATGDHIQFKADVANTGIATLAVNGATAAAIKKWGGAGNLIANDLLAGHWISATFDGTYWQLEGQLGNANATQLNGTLITGVSGSGSVLALTASPTFTGNATTFANGVASQDYLVLQPGTGSTDQIGALEFANYAGTSQWEIRKDASNTFRIRDTVNSLDREVNYAGGQTVVNSGGSASVAINNTSNAGTGGFIVYEGGSNYNTAALTVTSAGNASIPGGFTSSTLTDTGLTTAGVVTTTSGGLLGSVATTGTGSAVLATSPTVNGLTDSGTENLTTLNVSGASTFTGTVTMNGSCTGSGCTQTNTPAWLMYLANGSDGANTNANGSMYGEFYYTNFTVPYGNTVTVSDPSGLVIHATGSCTIAGTIRANVGTISYGYGGASGGGGGGGTAAGTAGMGSQQLPANSPTQVSGGSAGAASGGVGGIGNNLSYFGNYALRSVLNSGATGGHFLNGGNGGTGGSSGGAGGIGGNGVVLICGSITGTDGTHTGSINVSGGAGNPPAANSTGGGGGGGGGLAILSSRSTVTTWPTIYSTGGPGALATVPQALGVGGSCTTQPKATLGVTSGALNGSCTVVTAGAGCGTGTGLTWSVLGGGGTLGTATVNPTWSGGALASCTTTAGTSTGYTAATYTTSGAGGDGGAGTNAEYQGW